MGNNFFKSSFLFSVIFGLFLTVLTFQNCGPGFETPDELIDTETDGMVTLRTRDEEGKVLLSNAGVIDDETGDIVVGGDMIIGHEDELDENGEIDFDLATSGVGNTSEVQSSLAQTGRKWGSVVPYFFAEGSEFTTGERRTILRAIESFNNSMSRNKINLSFRRFQAGDRKAVGFVSGGSRCRVKNFGAPDDESAGIYLGANCFSRYVIIHEMMHILGFIHEHQRADRVGKIQINRGNVLKSARGAFNIINSVSRRTPYDIYSIMHYPDNIFSSNGKPTMERIVNGQRKPMPRFTGQLSGRDIAGLRAVYGSTTSDNNRPPPEVIAPLPEEQGGSRSYRQLQAGKKYRHQGKNVYFNGKIVCDLDSNSRSTRGLIDTDKNSYPALKARLKIEFKEMYQKSRSARQCGF